MKIFTRVTKDKARRSSREKLKRKDEEGGNGGKFWGSLADLI